MVYALTTLNRRFVLKAFAGAVAASALTPRSGYPARRELPVIPLAPFRRPEPGLIEYYLDARPNQIRVAGTSATLWTYGGRFPGPLLRARVGDTLRLHFTNRIGEVTNLHFHGMHIPPGGRADNIWLSIAPGETFTYEFTIPPDGGGTYWYHPHAHGAIARQLWAGMAGPILIETPLDALPELSAADDRIVVLKDLELQNQHPAPHAVHDWHKGKEGPLVLVNGVQQPYLTARAGLVRLRLINTCNARYFRLQLEGRRPLHLIAADGRFVESPIALEEILITPGARADVLVEVDAERALRLLHLPYDRRASRTPISETTLLTLSSFPSRVRPALPSRLAEIAALRLGDAKVTRRINMAMFLINGQPFRLGRIDTAGRLGDLEHWEVTNVGTMDHNFHLHTWYFQLAALNGRAPRHRTWLDTLNLRPGDGADLLIPLRSFAGTTVYHCHISEHGDKGMMATIAVEK